MRAPWYQIAWRAVWIVPAWTLVCLLCVVTFIGWGPNDAKRMWRNVT